MSTLQIVIICLFASSTLTLCTIIITASLEKVALIKRGVVKQAVVTRTE